MNSENPYRRVWDEIAQDDQAVDRQALRDGMAIPKSHPAPMGNFGGTGREKLQHLPNDHDERFDETFKRRAAS